MKYRIYLLIFAFVFALTMLWGVGWYLSKPANELITMPKEYESVVINGTHGSFLKSDNNQICALLIHDKLTMNGIYGITLNIIRQ
ncbi:hypothetical protein PGH07_05180 [Sulfurovum sp. zt1-1]|uniref:Uncharacterized protein n=1 Tax=Sulfurovum zhangzhouensis TaxID=3019067 RepID=A0ABT7QXJ6_9BACT|nr:hypothetical protein [Sulfurovum zhangzhouensis]MDM5271559.1 hypothetical protein [Sulfurovum zhangzhouensis]